MPWLEITVGGGLVLVVLLAMLWVRQETRAAATSQAKERESRDALEALQRGEKCEAEARSLSRRDKLRILQERAARDSKGVPRGK